MAGMSDARWRQIAKGFKYEAGGIRVPARAPADTLARMARVVGATPDQLREVGRGDAADELENLPEIQAPPKRTTSNLGRGLASLIPNTPTTPHDEHFERAERQLSYSRLAAQQGNYLGAITSLEGVESTAELLIRRLTDEAIRNREGGAPHADQPQSPADPSASSGASDAPESDEDQEVTPPREGGALLDFTPPDVDDLGVAAQKGVSHGRRIREQQDRDAEELDE